MGDSEPHTASLCGISLPRAAPPPTKGTSTCIWSGERTATAGENGASRRVNIISRAPTATRSTNRRLETARDPRRAHPPERSSHDPTPLARVSRPPHHLTLGGWGAWGVALGPPLRRRRFRPRRAGRRSRARGPFSSPTSVSRPPHRPSPRATPAGTAAPRTPTPRPRSRRRRRGGGGIAKAPEAP